MIESQKDLTGSDRIPKFSVGDIVYYNGMRVTITDRELVKDWRIWNAGTTVWVYRLKSDRYSGRSSMPVRGEGLIRENEPVLCNEQIDFDDMSNENELVCPFCRKHNFEQDIVENFPELEGSAELTCPSCNNQFQAYRRVVFYYDLSQSEDEEYLQRVTEKDDADDEQIDD